jgi:hypothetical protein
LRDRNVAAIATYLARPAWHGEINMTRYSIRKLGGEYIVLADDQCILKFTNRRKAEKLVADAGELLSVQSALPRPSGKAPDQSPVKGAKFLDGKERFP